MTCKRQLAHRSENSQTPQSRSIGRRKHEDRLGQIHLSSNLLHQGVGQIAGFGKDRKRISLQCIGRKYIELEKSKMGHMGALLCWALSSTDERAQVKSRPVN